MTLLTLDEIEQARDAKGADFSIRWASGSFVDEGGELGELPGRCPREDLEDLHLSGSR